MSKPLVEFDTSSLEGLDERLKLLVPMIRGEKGFAQNPLRTAIRKAADVVMAKAIDNAKRIDRPESETSIYEAIVRTPISTKDRDAYLAAGDSLEGYRIAVRISSKSGKPHAAYWGFVELGTDQQKAQPYLRPALETESQKAIYEFSDSLSKSLDRIAAKLRRMDRL